MTTINGDSIFKSHPERRGRKRVRSRVEMAFIPNPKALATGLLIGLLMFRLSVVVESNPNTKVSETLCNTRIYSKGDPFAISLAYVLAELESVTPSRQGYDYHNISPYPNSFAYGHASCNKNLTATDCGTCLAAAKTAMLKACDSRIGARAVLVDCTIRYEQYPFDD